MSVLSIGPTGAEGAPVVALGGVRGTLGALPGEGTPSGGGAMPPVREGSTTGVATGADDPLAGGATPPVM
jgi:hypothetical protein